MIHSKRRNRVLLSLSGQSFFETQHYAVTGFTEVSSSLKHNCEQVPCLIDTHDATVGLLKIYLSSSSALVSIIIT